MISILSNNSKNAYGLQEYLCDAEEDIAVLPKDATPGSIAIVIAENKVYMLNNKKEWIYICNIGAYLHSVR